MSRFEREILKVESEILLRASLLGYDLITLIKLNGAKLRKLSESVILEGLPISTVLDEFLIYCK